MARGIRRIKDGWANQHSTIVQYDDGTELEVPESRYREESYEPPFDELPWADQGKKIDAKRRGKKFCVEGILSDPEGGAAQAVTRVWIDTADLKEAKQRTRELFQLSRMLFSKDFTPEAMRLLNEEGAEVFRWDDAKEIMEAGKEVAEQSRQNSKNRKE